MGTNHEIRGVLFDLDGTIYQGDHLIDGVLETLGGLADRQIPYRFVTNTTSKPRQQVVAKLKTLGIEVPVDSIFTAPAVAHRFLVEHGLRRCFFLIKPSLLADFPGIEAVEEDPEAVVIGDLGDQFGYNNLNLAFEFLLNDARFLTLARNRYFKKKGKLSLDVGPFVAALEYATQREAELLGKPSATFYHEAVASMDLAPDQVVMIGDDLEGDVLGSQEAGLHGLAVRTGKFQSDDDGNQVESIESVAALGNWLGW